MKIINSLLAILFLIFAVVQYNDPDPWLWIALYTYISIISGMAVMGQYNKSMIGAGLLVCVGGFFFLLPDFINWLNTGAESIVESMKAEKPHIELTREFLGLLICILVLGFHWRKSS